MFSIFNKPPPKPVIITFYEKKKQKTNKNNFPKPKGIYNVTKIYLNEFVKIILLQKRQKKTR